MDKIIGVLLVISAIVTIMLSFGDSTRVFVGQMRNYLKNIGVLFALLLTTTLSFSAENTVSIPSTHNINSKFILNGSELMDPRAIEKIDTMGKELFVKTGVNAYIYLSNHYANQPFDDMERKIAFIKSFENNLTKNLDKPYSLITISLEDKRINLLSSPSLDGIVDKDELLNGYIIPLLASEADKNPLKSKVSAALLNGYSELVEEIAQSQGKTIDSAIKGNGKLVGNIWKIFIYTLVFFGLVAYTYAVWKDKRKGQNR